MAPWRTPRLATVVTTALLISGCALETSAPTSRSDNPAPRDSTGTATRPAAGQSTAKVDPAQVERLKRAMIPLLRVANTPRSPSEIKVGILDDPQINAASAGSGEFYVTTGLLQKANDAQLMGVLAHEIAHDDLGHVAKAQALNTGLSIGMVILDQIIPGSGQLTPIAGQLIARTYSRNEEYAADRHGAVLLERAGRPRQVMIDTLTWLMQASGSEGGGGFFSTHPATDDRIDALRKL